jgi:hypothetical protein
MVAVLVYSGANFDALNLPRANSFTVSILTDYRCDYASLPTLIVRFIQLGSTVRFRFFPAVSSLWAFSKEYPPDGEEKLIQQILEISSFSMKAKPHPPTRRDQHPKSHGYIQGEFIVEGNISDRLPDGFSQQDFQLR